MLKEKKDVIVIGGGAAGFFAAINIAKNNNDLKVLILERSKEVLSKVKISGGGRCNVTHACFDPKELISYYPRGAKELLGPFHTFSCGDTFAWFEERGIELKIEEDGRVFPNSNTSQTIIDCFLSEAKKYNVTVVTGCGVDQFLPNEGQWELQTKKGNIQCDHLIVAAGSSPKVWKMLEYLGHEIVNPVPSLFTFNIKDERLDGMAGIVIPDVEIKVRESNLSSEGPLLVTHWGLSAPSILKLSAYGARELANRNYQFEIKVNFISRNKEEVIEEFKNFRLEESKTSVAKNAKYQLPKRFWKQLVSTVKIKDGLIWADISNHQITLLADQLTNAVFKVEGKSTFKEEFVTAGGVALKEVNFKKFESKLHQQLYFAGEVLNIDAVTGGFNFQNAWTGAYVISQSISG